MSVHALQEFDPDLDLVLEDGVPLETWYHHLQMTLFLELVRYRMLELGHRDFFLGGDMFVYYSLEQAAAVAEEERQLALFEEGLRPDKPKKTAYRGPDAFLIKDVPTHKRDVWKVWEEGDRYPDLILELLSPSTARDDYGKKKDLYQDVFETSEYFLYAPDAQTFDGYRLLDNAYQTIPRSAEGRRWSRELEVELGIWYGKYEDQEAHWLRLFYPDGSLVPTKDECTDKERRRREAAESRAEQAESRAGQAESRAEQAESRAEQAESRAEQARRDREAAENRARAAELELARLRARYEDG